MDERSNDPFQVELSALLNKYGFDSNTDTPDFILAAYLRRCLSTWRFGVGYRDEYFNVDHGAVPETLQRNGEDAKT